LNAEVFCLTNQLPNLKLKKFQKSIPSVNHNGHWLGFNPPECVVLTSLYLGIVLPRPKIKTDRLVFVLISFLLIPGR